MVQAIAAAARELNEQRERWLNPPEWIDPIAQAVDRTDAFADVPESARPLIRQSAIMARATQHPQLKKRTLTNLYNERPTWLRLAHRRLDEAVLAAYAAVDPEGGWSPEWAEVWEETGAGQPLQSQADVAQTPSSVPAQPGAAVPHLQPQPGAAVPHPLTARRGEIEQKVLANLLRLNQARAKGER